MDVEEEVEAVLAVYLDDMQGQGCTYMRKLYQCMSGTIQNDYRRPASLIPQC
jgi:hypothetical protein